jgi:hypothetical protein
MSEEEVRAEVITAIHDEGFYRRDGILVVGIDQDVASQTSRFSGS